MELKFEKIGNRYQAEVEITNNFNLHIERKSYGRLSIYQKTQNDSNYATEPSYSNVEDTIFNKDFIMGIYPKFIKIVSESEPVKGIVTMEGESGQNGTTDNPDDYEQDLELICIDNNENVEAYTLSWLQNEDVAFPNMTPLSITINCYYIKNNERIPFIPADYEIITRFYPKGPELTKIKIENNRIVIVPPINNQWEVASQQLTFTSSKMNFSTYINTAL